MIKFVISGAILLTFLAGLPIQSNQKNEIGRWQIVYAASGNGGSGRSLQNALLDTQTGDTWVVCGDVTKDPQWCPVDRDYIVGDKVVTISPKVEDR